MGSLMRHLSLILIAAASCCANEVLVDCEDGSAVVISSDNEIFVRGQEANTALPCSGLTEIVAKDRGLVRVHDSLGQLSKLRYLDLSNNMLTVLPEWIGHLAALEILKLGSNQLSSLPESIGQLSHLTELSLRSKKVLTGHHWTYPRGSLTALPETFGQLSALRVLYLEGNQLAALPASFSQLDELCCLYLDGNLFTAVPLQIRQLSIFTLNLGENLLTSVPEWIGEFGLVSLKGNLISSLPDTIGNVSILGHLSIGGNQFTSLPESMGKWQMNSLRLLDLSSGMDPSTGRLTSLPDSIGHWQLPALEYLWVSRNQLATLPESLGLLSTLVALTLNDNLLTSLPDSIGQLSALEVLELQNNQLTALPESIGQLRSLRHLYLSGNLLTGVPTSMQQLSALSNLDLRGNQFAVMPLLLCSPSVEDLDLQMPDLDYVACAMSGCRLNCSCKTLGFSAVLEDGKFHCNDIDECHDERTCGAHTRCYNTIGSFYCGTCSAGFTRTDSVGSCLDIDECAEGSRNCPSSAACINTEGSFSCQCNTGFDIINSESSIGISCANHDECLDKTHNCHPDADCADTTGSFTCSCRLGYHDESGNGLSCTDIDECSEGEDDCDQDATCTNTIGSFVCKCRAEAVDWSEIGVSCDENQCSTGSHNCAVGATCTDTEGSFTCQCNVGFESEDGGVTCVEGVDECATLQHNCNEHALCSNTLTGFTCTCIPGYSGEGTNCADANECSTSLAKCDVDATCTNTDGSYVCECKPGFEGDGIACEDLDECLVGSDNCHEHRAICFDTRGSFTCTCNTGYAGDGIRCSEALLPATPVHNQTAQETDLISFTATLNMALVQFDVRQQEKYKTAVATVAGAERAAVVTLEATRANARRSSELEHIIVPTTVRVPLGRAEAVIRGLSSELSEALHVQGITLLSLEFTNHDYDQHSSSRFAALIGGIVAGVGAVLLVGVVGFRKCNRNLEPAAATPLSDSTPQTAVTDIVQQHPRPPAARDHCESVSSGIATLDPNSHENPSAPPWNGIGSTSHEHQHYSVPVIAFHELGMLVPVNSGSFKSVFKAVWSPADDPPRTVGVLALRSGFLHPEKVTFERLGRHPSLTQLFAVTTNPAKQECLVTEFAEHGSLDVYLQQQQDMGRAVSVQVLLAAAVQVCKGMQHLASHRVIHRDLAARNVLVFAMHATDEQQVQVKITDYGLAVHGSSVYTFSTQGGLLGPVRWMSPESIARRRYTEKSDVFAFAVTLWEMWAMGAIPWSIHSDAEVARMVQEGVRLECPPACPQLVYTVMRWCWAATPNDRPTFAQVLPQLENGERQAEPAEEERMVLGMIVVD